MADYTQKSFSPGLSSGLFAIGILLFLALVFGNKTFSQEIILVEPASGFAGQQGIPVVITCMGVNSSADYEDVIFENPGAIIVESWEAVNPARLEVLISIPENANPSPGEGIIVKLKDGTEIFKPDVFEIKTPGPFEVFLTVIPADPLYLSSFDPEDPQNSPLLFLVQLANEDKDYNYLRVVFTLRNEDYGGVIGDATKYYDVPDGNSPYITGMPYAGFDNREFDEYNISSEAGALIDEAMQTGMLPPGVYEYYIDVYDAYGNHVGGDVGQNIVTNLITSVDLIGPGNTLDFSPEVVYSANPWFQWFSGALSFDFALYEVMEGQVSPDEITTNLPVFEELNYGATDLLYPSYAELLEPGTTYAWQVKAYFEGTMGPETIFSDVFWFSYQSGGNQVLDHIEVFPDEATLFINNNFQFYAIGFDTNGDTLEVTCNWQVIPSGLATINEEGLFTAGPNPGTMAVVAHCEGMQSYSTVTVEFKGDEYGMFNMLKLLMDILGVE